MIASFFLPILYEYITAIVTSKENILCFPRVNHIQKFVNLLVIYSLLELTLSYEAINHINVRLSCMHSSKLSLTLSLINEINYVLSDLFLFQWVYICFIHSGSILVCSLLLFTQVFRKMYSFKHLKFYALFSVKGISSLCLQCNIFQESFPVMHIFLSAPLHILTAFIIPKVMGPKDWLVNWKHC